ncbi:MAG: N-6 DNA methylase [Candidatus Thorarchaeota archaeon]|nr:N-6 DNA methylase [Candidatus Thorarchaeota archaeon]
MKHVKPDQMMQFYSELARLKDMVMQDLLHRDDRDILSQLVINRVVLAYFSAAEGLLGDEHPVNALADEHSPLSRIDSVAGLQSAASTVEVSRRTLRALAESLDTYSWTLDENTSNPSAVSPSLIGRDLERLVNRTHQRATGSFYTPTWIASYIVRSAMDARLAGTLDDLGHPHTDRSCTDLNMSSKLELAEAEALMGVLARLRVCDMACGAGVFLVMAARYLLGLHRVCAEAMSSTDSPTAQANPGHARGHEAVHRVLSSLYGCDIRPDALDTARLRLQLEYLRETPRVDSKLEDCLLFRLNLACGDSLLGDTEEDESPRESKSIRSAHASPGLFSCSDEEQGFDLIVGNPPYYRLSRASPDYISRLQRQYSHIRLESNVYVPFIERGYHLLREGGVLSYLVHKNLLTLNSFSSLRRWLLHECRIERLVDLGGGVFPGVTAETAVFALVKRRPHPESTVLLCSRAGGSERIVPHGSVAQHLFADEVANWEYRWPVYLDKTALLRLQRIRSRSRPLSSYLKVSRGIETGDNSRLVSCTPGASETWRSVIRGKDIARYRVMERAFINYCRTELSGPRNADMYAWEKLVTQQNSKYPVVAYDRGGHFVLNSATFMVCRDDVVVDLRTLLLILNSRLLQWVFRTMMTNRSEVTVNILPNNLGLLPIRLPERTDCWRVLADYMTLLAGMTDNAEDRALFEALDRKVVDPLVEELYLRDDHQLEFLIASHIVPIEGMSESAARAVVRETVPSLLSVIEQAPPHS